MPTPGDVTGPVRVFNSENLDTAAKLNVAFNQRYAFKPTAGVAYLQVDILANVADDANAAYIACVGILRIDVKVGGNLLYTVHGQCAEAVTATGYYVANPLAYKAGALGVLNRAIFGSPPNLRITTLSSLSATNSNCGINFKLPIFQPEVAAKGQEIVVEVFYADGRYWQTSAAHAEAATVTMQEVIIEAQYANEMPSFKYLNNEKTGVGASLVQSVDGFALDAVKDYYVIGGVWTLNQSTGTAFFPYITRVQLIDTNRGVWNDQCLDSMLKEEEERSCAYTGKADATTGGWAMYPHSYGAMWAKVDEVESNGTLKWAIYTHASASSATIRVLTLLRAKGRPISTSPRKGGVSSQADQAGSQTSAK